MRKFTLLLSSLALCASALKAQTVSTFEALPLSGTDTFYINTTSSMTDLGFNDGLAHFPYYYDTSFGGYWAGGFAFSNKADSTTSGYTNQYAAKPAAGYGGSAKYAVCWCTNPWTYEHKTNVLLTGAAMGKSVTGVYITNGTYAFNSMRDGDGVAKQFGDTTGTGLTTGQGTAPDWFKVTIKAYSGGTLGTDSVDFYLADFRPAGTANDSIIRGWHWVNLLPLGHADSLQFSMSSSDNGSFGMNTPAYFCIDNFTTNETSVAVNNVAAPAARIYPNPAAGTLNIDLNNNEYNQAYVVNAAGSIVYSTPLSAAHTSLNTAELAPGYYLLRLTGNNQSATIRFVKE